MNDSSTNTPQLALALAHSDKASFENYWVGQNQELLSALTASISRREPKVIYYYGNQGAGKSHLLFAAMRFAKDAQVKTSYVSLADAYVAIDMLKAIDVSTVVCVDNIDMWAGDTEKERALFTLFEQIKHAGGGLLISASKTPDQAGFHLKDLISRLSSGLIYALYELTEEGRFDAIKMRAQQRGLAISDEVVKYLLNRLPRDNQQLFQTLDRLDQASLVEKRKITIPFLQTLLKP